ncbi:MAG TPA: hypothetical protein VE544_03240 [Nitrososphaeraceae archaeon]|jgi:hypothetical protein|nr:hypothetical protein [Nitrososphaeraceae archaeon]
MNGSSIKSQIFVAIGVAIVASVLVTGLASTIYAQSNMTGGNMTIIDTISDGGSGDGDDDGIGDGDGEGDDNDGQSGEGGENN